MRALLVLFLLTRVSFAQLPNISFEHITDRDGLPSRSVTCAVEDTSGFMWFGTRKCLSRYDGYTFQRADTKNVYGVAMTKTSTLYCSTEKEQLVRVEPNSLKTTTIVGIKEGGGNNTFVDSYEHVWFSDRETVCRYEPATDKTFRYPMKKTTFIFHKGSFVEDSQRNVWILGMEVGLLQFDRKTNKLSCKLGLDCPRPAVGTNLHFGKGIINTSNVLWVTVAGRGLLRYDIETDQAKIYQYRDFVLLTVCEGTDELGKRILWVGTDRGLGIFRPDTEQFSFFENLIPHKYQVQDIYKSHKTGILWVCTSEGILKYDPHNQFIKTNLLPTKTHPVNAILIDKSDPTGQTVWLAVAYEGLYKWNRTTNKTTFYKFPQYSSFAEVTWLIQAEDHTIFAGCNQWHTWQDGQADKSDNRFEGVFRFDPVAGRYLATPFSIHHTFFSVPFYSLGLIDRKGRFWFINHYESVHVFDPKTNTECSLWSKEAHDELFANGNWVMDVFDDSRGHVWLTTYQGIFLFDEPAHRFRQTKTDIGMLKMAEAPNGNLWAVGWPGLLKVNKDGKIIRAWSQKDGLYDNECGRVLVDAKNQVWIGTYDGLHLFDEAKNSFRRFTVNDGLLTNSTIMSLCLTPDNKLLVGNVGGWNTLDIAALDRSATFTNIHLTKARINNQDVVTDWSKPVVLKPNETAISFDFSTLNYRKPTDNQYAYYLEGLEKTWIDAGQTHQAFYTNLDPNDYVFHARSTSPGAGNPLRIAFTIRPAFYETWWFRAILLVLVVGLLVFIYQNRLSYQTVKAKLALEEATLQQKEAIYKENVAAYQLKLSETEMAALRAQMNPHFIFNCLNSIQYFTAQNNAEKASDYLTKFSRLIRLVLENSKSEKVTLANELETLRLYIEMESMRFPNKLYYQIQLSDQIDAELTQIPPLLLQPFVENAIWHGLMHKEEGGNVLIQVVQQRDDLLHIEITDDGVGRQKAAEYKSKSAMRNKSFGMKLTAERIELINQLYHTQTQVRIVDLITVQGQAVGTQVIIEIPI
ncbi:hypothetical protein GCM10028818_23570 [Spirosoma horti]